MKHNYTVICSTCQDKKVLRLEESSVKRYMSGELAQTCFPELSRNDRELLISGTCGDCFDDMFGSDE